MSLNKKKAAAVAAVMAYMAEEQAVLAAQQPLIEKPEAPVAVPKLWGLSGRQSMMQFRSMMEMKAMHGWSIR